VGHVSFRYQLRRIAACTVAVVGAVAGLLSTPTGAASADSATRLLVSLVSPVSSPVIGKPVSVTVFAFGSGTSYDPTYNGVAQLTSTDSAAVLPASVTLTGGVGTALVTFNTGGTQTITATDLGHLLAPSTSYPFTVSTATHLVVTQPTAAVDGVAFTGTVEAEDAAGNLDATYHGMATVTSSDNAAMPDSVQVNLTAGVGTFTYTFLTPGNQSLIVVDDRAYLALGQTFLTVAPGATQLAFSIPSPVKFRRPGSYHRAS
jgi:hypothetical protein